MAAAQPETRAMTMMAANEKVALIAVTAFGVSPSWYAAAAAANGPADG